MKLIIKIVAVFIILYGLYSFSFDNLIETGVSTIMILVGTSMFLTDAKSESLQKIHSIISKIALVIAITLIIKTFVLG